MNLFISLCELVIGAVVLAWSADRFIVASADIARKLTLPSLVVGVILVGFGTSFPELVVAAIASWHAKPQIAIGNVIGSNIANIGLVVGLAATIIPIEVNSRLVKREFPVLIIVSIIIGALLFNGMLSRWDGVILLMLLCLHLYWVLKTSSSQDASHEIAEIEHKMHPKITTWKVIVWWFVGLLLLFISSEVFVRGAVSIAKLVGLSDLIIGLTIVTIGTSLPELAATIAGALRKQHDIAIGHIVGSNIFNSLAVLAMPALIHPVGIASRTIRVDYPLMVVYTVLLWLFTFCLPKKYRLGRGVGILLLSGYIIYLVSLIM